MFMNMKDKKRNPDNETPDPSQIPPFGKGPGFGSVREWTVFVMGKIPITVVTKKSLS